MAINPLDYLIPPVRTTGGTAQPDVMPQRNMTTGGNLPPNPTGPTTGGPLPPNPVGPTTGGNLPPDPLRNSGLPNAQLPQGSRPAVPGQNFSAANTVAGNATNFPTGAQANAGDIVQGYMDRFRGPALDDPTKTTMDAMDRLLSGGGSYMTNALRRGLSTANSRGLLNSSMAAGSAQRAAIESSMPILNEIMGLTRQREGQDHDSRQNAINQSLGISNRRESETFTDRQNRLSASERLAAEREGRAFQGQENALDRVHQSNMTNLQARNNMDMARFEATARERENQQNFEFRRALQNDTVAQEDWLADRNFTREFNAQISMLPIRNAAEITSLMNQFAISDPEVYTPQVISGMTNFLTQNMFSLFDQYFPGMINTTQPVTTTTPPTGG